MKKKMAAKSAGRGVDREDEEVDGGEECDDDNDDDDDDYDYGNGVPGTPGHRAAPKSLQFSAYFQPVIHRVRARECDVTHI